MSALSEESVIVVLQLRARLGRRVAECVIVACAQSDLTIRRDDARVLSSVGENIVQGPICLSNGYKLSPRVDELAAAPGLAHQILADVGERAELLRAARVWSCSGDTLTHQLSLGVVEQLDAGPIS